MNKDNRADSSVWTVCTDTGHLFHGPQIHTQKASCAHVYSKSIWPIALQSYSKFSLRSYVAQSSGNPLPCSNFWTNVPWRLQQAITAAAIQGSKMCNCLCSRGMFDCREDAEAPKAHLVKPSSSSSGSRSSRSGSSSTRSTANSASRSQRTLSTEATPHLTPPQYSQREMGGKETEPKKVDYANLMKMGATLVMVPAQSRAFQTVWLLRLLPCRNTPRTTSHIGIVRLASYLPGQLNFSHLWQFTPQEALPLNSFPALEVLRWIFVVVVVQRKIKLRGKGSLLFKVPF